jgi:hypothetical protein
VLRRSTHVINKATLENDMTVATIILNIVFVAFVVAAVVGGLWRSIVLHRRDQLRTAVGSTAL